MNTSVRRKLEMAARVREFCRAHAPKEPGFGVALTRFEEKLTRAEAIAAREHDGRLRENSARAHRKAVRQAMHFQLLRYLVAVGFVAAKDRTELAERFKLPPTNATNTTFLTAVKGLLATAVDQKELLVSQGMAEGLLADLGERVKELEAAVEAARTGRRDHIGARADLDEVTTELVDLVRVLDGVARYRLGNNPELMTEWNAAKLVLGVPHPKKGLTGSEGGVEKPAA